MSSATPASDKLDAIKLLKIIIKWKKPLIYVALGSIVVSFLFTLPVIMKPMFKATAVVYPVNLQPYSKETPTEQLVQLFNSEDIRDHLVKDFSLYKHLGIDSTGSYPRFEMMKRLDENISIDKTQFESVEINVFDTDPQTASDMCDSITSYVDLKAITLLRERAQEATTVYKNQMLDKKHEMDSMESAILNIRTQYGITDFENQIEGFSREYYRSLASGGTNQRMEQVRKNLEEKGGEYVTLKEHLWRARGAYNDYKAKYELAYADVVKQLKFHNMITKPMKPERKDSPKRTLIMLVFTISVVFVALLVIIYQEHFRKRFEEELSH